MHRAEWQGGTRWPAAAPDPELLSEALFGLQCLLCTTVTWREFLLLSGGGSRPEALGASENYSGRLQVSGRHHWRGGTAGVSTEELGSQPHLQPQGPQAPDTTPWVAGVLVT